MRNTAVAAVAVTVVLLLVGSLMASQPGGDGGPQEPVVAMATEYGLNRNQIASFDARLCARLIRFGKVAQGRGRHKEAKRFYWKALLVDPTSMVAWQCYDQAVVYSLADSVEKSPGLVGLPGLADEPAPEKAAQEPEIEEGC